MNVLSLKYINYLSNIDQLYKFNLQDINEIPKLTKISIIFSLNQINTLTKPFKSNRKKITSDTSELSGSEDLLNLKAYFFFYLLLQKHPFINFRKIWKIKNHAYSLRTTLTNKNIILKVLHLIFLTIYSNRLPLKILYIKTYSKTTKNCTSVFYLRIPCLFLLDSNLYFKKIYSSSNLKSSFFYLKFKIISPSTIEIKNLLLNLIYFWWLKL